VSKKTREQSPDGQRRILSVSGQLTKEMRFKPTFKDSCCDKSFDGDRDFIPYRGRTAAEWLGWTLTKLTYLLIFMYMIWRSCYREERRVRADFDDFRRVVKRPWRRGISITFVQSGRRTRGTAATRSVPRSGQSAIDSVDSNSRRPTAPIAPAVGLAPVSCPRPHALRRILHFTVFLTMQFSSIQTYNYTGNQCIELRSELEANPSTARNVWQAATLGGLQEIYATETVVRIII